MSVTIKGSKIYVDGTAIDLTAYQGQRVTVFSEDTGEITIESKQTHKIAICELDVPVQTVDSVETGEKDGDMPVMETQTQPLSLKGVEIRMIKGGI